MAVLEAPVTHHAVAAKTSRKRRARKPMPWPMLVLGTMVAVAVGYGAGTVAQFDADWRKGTPQAVEVASGTVTAGGTLAQTVQELLSDKSLPVRSVVCAEPVTMAAGAGTTAVSSGSGLVNPQLRMCRAQTTSGMVNIVTQTSGDQVDLTVFLAE